MGYRVGVDIGGSFTDFAVFDEDTGDIKSLKVFSRPDQPGEEVIAGVRMLGERYGIQPSQISYFTHGTTVGINTVIQRKGLKLALFATENFCDVLELARLKTPDMYHLLSRRAEPLIKRSMVFGIAERMAPDGSVRKPLDEESVKRAIQAARDAGAEGIVISLLHAYRNPAHELRVKEIIADIAPDLPVSCSSETWPIIREYERTITAVIGGYVQPRVAHYLGSLQNALKNAGVQPEPRLTKSNGGVMTAEQGKRDCVQMILSGTAAGVIGASHVAATAGIPRCLSLDIGGTSADIAVIIDGKPQYGVGELIGDFQIHIPSVSVSSVGEGGGSIAWVDPLGVLKVGPESAGSRPGPACYNRGGTRATITDAFVCCGLVGHSDLGYKAVEVDVEAARKAVGELATQLGRGIEETAEAIIQIAVSGMYSEVSGLVSRYGIDPREYAVLAFGGAGPMLGCFLAREIKVQEIVVPPSPGTLSALGGLIADLKSDFLKTVYTDLTPDNLAAVRDEFAILRERAEQWLMAEQGHINDAEFVYSAEMRYRGQSYEIDTVLDPAHVAAGDVQAVGKAFHEMHRRLYGHADERAPVQMVSLRVVISGNNDKPQFPRHEPRPGTPEPERQVRVWLDGGFCEVDLYSRSALSAGQEFHGPAIVTQDDCTTVIPGDHVCRVDEFANLRITSEGAASPGRSHGRSTNEQPSLQVLANHCTAAAEAMGYTLMRTAYSTFVKETEDFSAQLMTPDGKTFASPKTFGATWYTGLDYGRVIAMFDDYREGDIYLTNDPYSGFVATHTPDMHVWKPVFRDGRLVCFVGSHIHNTDMGGAVPASLSRTLTEVHQEGLRIPPMLLMRDGVMDEKLLRIMQVNVRMPDQNHGDLNAQIAALNVGERKVHEIIDRFGVDEFMQGAEAILDYAEQQTRALIREMPDGDYEFSEYADEDSVNGYPCRIHITLRVRGDELELDFTGSDPQVASSLNVPTGGDGHHSVITVGLIYVMHTLAPRNVLNFGSVRPIRAVLPEGSIVNPQAPAAVGMRSLTAAVIQACTFGVFNRALPDRLPACPAGGSTLLNVKTATRGGRQVLSSIGPCGGGGGGGPEYDGVEGCGANSAFLKNTPVEINEAEVPIEIIRYGLVPDTGGAGRLRGGNAATMEFKLLAPNGVVTARNRNRSELAAWGVVGGKAGANSRFMKNPDGEKPEELRNSDLVNCAPGDVIRLQGPAGGGYGDPHERPVEKVLEDVRCGFVSPQRAREEYGVAVRDDMSVDEAATRKLRAGGKHNAQRQSHFDYGPGRTRFESIWTAERYDAMSRIMAAIPVSWRHFVKHQMFAALAGTEPPKEGGADAIERIYRQLSERYADLPTPEAIAEGAQTPEAA